MATPDPEEVTLPWVAEDADGALTSAAGEDGVRLLRVFSCEDEGETTTLMGYGQLRICTLRQRADKGDNGDFAYQDWDAAVAGEYDPDDVHAEVSLYWHASRAYELITSAEVGLFDRLPGIHDADGEAVPLNLVANYRWPVSASADALEPTAMAFHMPHEYMSMGMDQYTGLLGYAGDFLAFGQGSQADFAYDGETVYHEFGHVVTRSVGGLENHLYVDEYGLCNLTNALEQGLTETLVFLLSGRSTLFDYLDQVSATGGYLREADNDDVYPANLQGMDPFDGMVVAGAHWDLHQELEGCDERCYARLLLLSLQENQRGDLEHSFSRYAETFLGVLEAEGLEDQLDMARETLEARGLFEEERSREIPADGSLALYLGGAQQAAWNTWLDLQDGDQLRPMSTATVQTWVEPAGTELELQAWLYESSDAMGLVEDPSDWDLRIFLRAERPVVYGETAHGAYSAERDAELVPELEESGGATRASWTLEGLLPGQRLYLHFVNFGEAPVVLSGISLSGE